MRKQGILLAMLALTAGGCSEDVDRALILKSLRVLGVQHEPVWPAPGETSRLTPIIYTPEGTSPPTFEWSWCPFPGPAADGYPCMVTAETLGAQIPGLPPSDLGTAGTADFPYTFDPTPLAVACAQGFTIPGQSEPTDPPDCRMGFGVQVKVKVSTATPVADSIVVVDTMRLPVTDPPGTNANPTLGTMTATIGGVDVPLDDLGSVTLPRDVMTPIKLTVPDTAVDEYPNPKLAICPTAEPTRRETLQLDWFVECGSLDKERSGYREGINTLADAGTNKWDPGLLKDCTASTARIFVVMRDAREVMPSKITLDEPCETSMGNRLAGGIAWMSAKITVGAQP